MNFSIYSVTEKWARTSSLKVHASPSVSSTNDVAKAEAFDISPSEIHVYLAEHQTAGRGRGNNSWIDESQGGSLLSTWSLTLPELERGPQDPQRIPRTPQPILAPALGLALFRAVHSTWLDLNLGLKPPNDLFCDRVKVAGLLIETVQQGSRSRLIIGLGLNVFSKPKLDTAGCLNQFLESGRLTRWTWTSFLDRWLLEVVAALQEPGLILSVNQCKALLHAINARQGAPDRLHEVQPDGSLMWTNGRVQDWLSL